MIVGPRLRVKIINTVSVKLSTIGEPDLRASDITVAIGSSGGEAPA